MIIAYKKKYKDVSWPAGNRTYFAAISLFRNRLLSRATKIRLYKTLVRPVVTYGAETWTMTKKEEPALLIFERKVFRRIYGPKYEDGEWKSRTNRELEKLSKGENIRNWINGQRISWLGHLERMEEDRMLRKRSALKNWKGRDEEEDPGKDGEKKWEEIFKCWA
jgi:hypothetical protein